MEAGAALERWRGHTRNVGPEEAAGCRRAETKRRSERGVEHALCMGSHIRGGEARF